MIRIRISDTISRKPLHNAFMGIPLQIKPAKLKALGAIGTDTACLNYRKASDKIRIVELCVGIPACSGIGHNIIPAFRICFLCCL